MRINDHLTVDRAVGPQPHLPTATRFTVDRVSNPGPFGSEADALPLIQRRLKENRKGSLSNIKPFHLHHCRACAFLFGRNSTHFTRLNCLTNCD